MTDGPAVSVIVACSRPHLIRGIATAIADQSTPGSVELIVAGETASLITEYWPVPTILLEVTDSHPNRRRCDAIATARGEVLAFIDDDVIPGSGWLAEVAALPNDSREIWTGPETPVRSGRYATLAHWVASSWLAEGTTAHVAQTARQIRWSDVPFCNLATTRIVLDQAGWPSTEAIWEVDDFEFCRRAHAAGVTFHNRSAMAVRHDRYPDDISHWLRDKAIDRFGTGERLVTHPELYLRIPGALIAAAAPVVLLIAGRRIGRLRHPWRTVGLGIASYIALITRESCRSGPLDCSPEPAPDRFDFVRTMGALHVVSFAAFHAGLARAALRRSVRAARPA